MDKLRCSRFFLMAIVAVAGGVAALPVSAQILCAVDSIGGQFMEIDSATAVQLSAMPVTVAGETVTHTNTLSRQPNSNVLYAIVRYASSGNETQLITLDPNTAVGTKVGATGLRIADMTFDDKGVLWAVNGDQNMGTVRGVPETLYTIDITNGSATLVLTLGNGDDGETIAFNVDDGFLYHGSGLFGGNIFERINRNSLVVSNIPLSGPGAFLSEFRGLVYDPAQGDFVMTDGVVLHRVSTSGVVGAATPMTGGLNLGVVRGLEFNPTFQQFPVATALGLIAAALLLCAAAAFTLYRFRRAAL